MKIYDLVKRLLEIDKNCRNNDKYLMLQVWTNQSLNIKLINNVFIWDVYDKHLNPRWFVLTAVTPESITRARRKVQELHPDLGPTEEVAGMRQAKEEEKGTHIFREEVLKQESLF